MTGLYLDDFQVGQAFDTPKRTVTEADIANFAGLSGDYNPLHTDDEFARSGRFGKRIAHGVLTLAILTGFWDRLGIISYTAEAFYGIENLKFTKPVFPGDTLRARIKVTDKQARDTNGMVTLENEVFNQKDETVLICTTKLIIKRKA
jgi:acyl dehydratase